MRTPRTSGLAHANFCSSLHLARQPATNVTSVFGSLKNLVQGSRFGGDRHISVVIPADLKPVAGCRKMTGRKTFFGGRACSPLTRRRRRQRRQRRQWQPPTTNFTVEKRKWSWHHFAVAAPVPVADAEVSVAAGEGGREGEKVHGGVGTTKFWGAPSPLSPSPLPPSRLSEM